MQCVCVELEEEGMACPDHPRFQFGTRPDNDGDRSSDKTTTHDP